jgi:hypothetical protein
VRISTCVLFVVLLTIQFSEQGVSQSAKSLDATKEAITFATNKCYSKAGLGIISGDLYIRVVTDKNELLFGSRESWSGLDSSQREIVVFFDNRVWPARSLPKRFDLSRAVIVSFEGDKVRFFDFRDMTGCYYARKKNWPDSKQ